MNGLSVMVAMSGDFCGKLVAAAIPDSMRRDACVRIRYGLSPREDG